MNNQDKPLDSNNYWERQVFDLFEDTNETDSQTNSQPKQDNSDDLWSEETMISSSSAEDNDSETSLGCLAENAESPESNLSFQELDLDDLDFRNPPNIEQSHLVPLESQVNDSSDLENIDLKSGVLDIETNELENNPEFSLDLDDTDLEELNNNLDLEELINLENFAEESEIDDLPGTEFQFAPPKELESDVASNSGLDELETQLNSSAELADLDSILDLDSAASIPTPPPAITTSQPSKPTKAPKPPEVAVSNQAKVFDQTMRVSVKKLDGLNNLIGELVVKRNRLEEDQERLRKFIDNLFGHVQSLGDAGARMHDMYERSLLEGALMASRQSKAVVSGSRTTTSFIDTGDQSQDEGLDALEMDRFTGFHLLSQEIIELIVRVREAASDIQFVVDESDKVTQTLRQVTTQLQEGMNSSRMVAFGQTADRLPRAIRDISRKLKKQANLHVEGKEVLIDKMIVEHLYNPMTHLVNNAISHGIEKPEVRLKLGKPEAGNIYIHAFIQGNQTVITVADDGAGIDTETVKAKAVEKNLITWAKAQQLSKQEIYELLFHPGFSTKDQADDFAGRGVGMDVVSTDLKKIRGTISTESELGKGTTFTIRLPLVLSICKALTCVDNNSPIAFPIDGVEDTKEYLPSDIQTNANGVRCISWNNTLLPLRPLSSLLSYNRQIRRAGIYHRNQNIDDIVSVVILRSIDHLLAVEVNEVRAEQEIVIKQIDGPIPKPPGIAGATVLGDGTIMPIGDVLELIEIALGKRTVEIGFNVLGDDRREQEPQVEEIHEEPMVLVVDDSITVRELLSLSFNKLGYRVEQARDGQEAWDKLRGGLPCDMIFCDIEMPRMNGLELLSNLQKHEQLKLIPVAMLTSRGADKHRNLANDLGAKAYLTKPYTEKALMDVAQRLIEINRANKETESVDLKSQKSKDVNSESTQHHSPLVLIIDDSVTVRELLSMTFRNAGYRVEQARDGQEAWDKLRDGLECDIAFCDIEMPRMNGLELLSQLQTDEKLSTLPIAMLTSRGAQKMRNIAAKRGATGYFVKPYVEETLLDAAKKMINGEILIDSSDLEG